MQAHCYNDFDEFANSIKNVNSKMLLRAPQNRTWKLSSVNLNGINVQTGQLGSGNIAEGELTLDGYMLYLPLTYSVEYSANGNILKNNSLVILEPGCEFCITTKEEHDWYAVFIPSDMLPAGVETEESLRDSGGKRLWVTQPNRQVVKRLQSLVGSIMKTARHYSQFESTSAASCAAAELLKIASLEIGQSLYTEPRLPGRPRLQREEVIRSAKKYLEARHKENVYVEELAIAAQVSERTLRTVFNEYYGVGPVKYLQLRKLNQVHRALNVADPEEQLVSNILMAHGEWEFSRFASRYRRLFGELPSDTLQRKRS